MRAREHAPFSGIPPPTRPRLPLKKHTLCMGPWEALPLRDMASVDQTPNASNRHARPRARPVNPLQRYSAYYLAQAVPFEGHVVQG